MKRLLIEHGWKVVLGAVAVGILTWGGWVTRMCQKAEKSEEILDTQVMILHSRITKVDDRINNVIWKFLEEEIEDCEEDRDGQADQSECVQTP
jgi:hypothetical protein